MPITTVGGSGPITIPTGLADAYTRSQEQAGQLAWKQADAQSQAMNRFLGQAGNAVERVGQQAETRRLEEAAAQKQFANNEQQSLNNYRQQIEKRHLDLLETHDYDPVDQQPRMKQIDEFSRQNYLKLQRKELRMSQYLAAERALLDERATLMPKVRRRQPAEIYEANKIKEDKAGNVLQYNEQTGEFKWALSAKTTEEDRIYTRRKDKAASYDKLLDRALDSGMDFEDASEQALRQSSRMFPGLDDAVEEEETLANIKPPPDDWRDMTLTPKEKTAIDSDLRKWMSGESIAGRGVPDEAKQAEMYDHMSAMALRPRWESANRKWQKRVAELSRAAESTQTNNQIVDPYIQELNEGVIPAPLQGYIRQPQSVAPPPLASPEGIIRGSSRPLPTRPQEASEPTTETPITGKAAERLQLLLNEYRKDEAKRASELGAKPNFSKARQEAYDAYNAEAPDFGWPKKSIPGAAPGKPAATPPAPDYIPEPIRKKWDQATPQQRQAAINEFSTLDAMTGAAQQGGGLAKLAKLAQDSVPNDPKVAADLKMVTITIANGVPKENTAEYEAYAEAVRRLAAKGINPFPKR